MIPCKGLGRETPLCVACQLPGKFLYRSRCKLEPVPSCFQSSFWGVLPSSHDKSQPVFGS